MPNPIRSHEDIQLEALLTLEDHPGFRLLCERLCDMLIRDHGDILRKNDLIEIGRMQGAIQRTMTVLELRESMMQELRNMLEQAKQEEE